MTQRLYRYRWNILFGMIFITNVVVAWVLDEWLPVKIAATAATASYLATTGWLAYWMEKLRAEKPRPPRLTVANDVPDDIRRLAMEKCMQTGMAVQVTRKADGSLYWAPMSMPAITVCDHMWPVSLRPCPECTGGGSDQ